MKNKSIKYLVLSLLFFTTNLLAKQIRWHGPIEQSFNIYQCKPEDTLVIDGAIYINAPNDRIDHQVKPKKIVINCTRIKFINNGRIRTISDISIIADEIHGQGTVESIRGKKGADGPFKSDWYRIKVAQSGDHGRHGSNGRNAREKGHSWKDLDGRSAHPGGNGSNGKNGRSGIDGRQGTNGEPGYSASEIIIMTKKCGEDFSLNMLAVGGRGGNGSQGGRGENGGRGGNGGNGGKGGDGSAISYSGKRGGNGGQGGNGGDGGDGGQGGSGGFGGHGGALFFFWHPDSGCPYKNVLSKMENSGGLGGQGGLGGDPGKGGRFGKGGNGGNGGDGSLGQKWGLSNTNRSGGSGANSGKEGTDGKKGELGYFGGNGLQGQKEERLGAPIDDKRWNDVLNRIGGN